MATSSKELSIILTAVDRLSAQMAQTSGNVGRELDKIGEKGEKTKGILGSLAEPLKSIGERLFEIAKAPGDSFLVEAIKGAIEGTVDQVAQLEKMSERLGLSVETLSEYRHASVVLGQDFTGIAESVSHFEKNLEIFEQTGQGKAKLAFETLEKAGFKFRGEMTELEPALAKVADALEGMSVQRRQLVAQQLFPGNPQGMLDLLAGGSAGLSGRLGDAKRTNTLLSPETVRTAHEMEQAINRVREAWFGVRTTVAEQFEPAITAALNRITEFLADAPEKVKLIGHLLHDMVSPDAETRDAAKAGLVQIMEALADYTAGAAKETGTLVGREIVYGVRIGLAAAGDDLGDWFTHLDDAARNSIRGSLGLDAEYLDGHPEAFQVQIDEQTKIVDGLRARAAAAQRDLDKAKADADKWQGQGGEGFDAAMQGSVGAAQLILDKANGFLHDGETRLAGLRDSLVKFIAARTDAESKAIDAALQGAGGRLALFKEHMAKLSEDLTKQIGGVAAGPYGLPYPPSSAAAEQAERLRNQAEVSATELGEGQVSRAVDEITASLKEQDKAYDELNVKIAEYRRSMLAANDPREAQRQALLAQLAQERKQLFEGDNGSRFGAGTPEAKRQFDEVGDAMVHAFEGQTKLSKITQEADAIYQRYRDTLERTAEEVQTGNLEQFNATRINQEVADSVRKQLDAQKDLATELTKDYGTDLPKAIQEAQKQIATLIHQIGLATRPKPTDYLGGAIEGIKEFQARAHDFGQQGKDAAESVASSITNDLATAIDSAIRDWHNLGDAVKGFASQALLDIAKVAEQMLAMRLVSGAIDLFGGLASVGGEGGRANIGTLGNPFAGPPVGYHGTGGLAIRAPIGAASAGQGVGAGVSVNYAPGAVVVNVSGGDPSRVQAAVQAALLKSGPTIARVHADEIQRNGAARARLSTSMGGSR